MLKRTTTKQLSNALSSSLLQIEKVECSYKSSSRIDDLDIETFKDNLDFLCESGVFANFVDWHYEESISEKGRYIADSGAMNHSSENIIIVHLCANENADTEEIERALAVQETEE